MKRPALLTSLPLLSAADAFAHPGHGRPGWWHEHGDLLLDAGLLIVAAAAAAILVLAVRKRLAR